MLPANIDTAGEFLSEVVEEDCKALAANVSLHTAFHACISLFSLRDWVFEEHKGAAWTFNGAALTSITGKEALSKQLAAIESSFVVIANVATSAKHMILDQNRNWQMYGSANVVTQSVGGTFQANAFQSNAFQTGSNIILADLGGTKYDVGACARDVLRMWKKIFAENRWT